MNTPEAYDYHCGNEPEDEPAIEATPITTTIVEYDPVAAGLVELRRLYQNVTYEVQTPAGMKLAKCARAEIKGLRVQVEATRKEIKAPALERCRLIDSEAKRITEELIALEQPIDQQIKSEQQRRREAREAAEEAERERLAAIERAKLAAEREAQEKAAAEQKAKLEAIRAELEAKAKADQERIDAERAKLAQERAEQEAAIEAAKAKAAAEAEAERKRLAAVEEQRIAKERERIAKEEADLAAERERLAAEKAAADAKAKAEREAREAAERKAREEAEAANLAALRAREADEIERADLIGAATDVVACFERWGVADELPARKLAAAVARECDRRCTGGR